MKTLDDVFREKELVDFAIGCIILIVVAIGITLGVVKVKNELQMTKAYDRQAAALERIADATERGVLIEQGCGQ